MSGVAVGVGLFPSATTFVSTASMTVADLLVNFPASAQNLGKYARVSDLYGNVDEIMRCSRSDSTYYWRPQRQDFAATDPSPVGTATLIPLLTPPIVFYNGVLTGNLNISPSATNAWPGCTFDVTVSGTLGIFTVTLINLLGANMLMGSGTNRRVTFDGTAWRAR